MAPCFGAGVLESAKLPFTSAHHFRISPPPIEQHALGVSRKSFVLVLEPGGQGIGALVLRDGLPEESGEKWAGHGNNEARSSKHTQRGGCALLKGLDRLLMVEILLSLTASGSQEQPWPDDRCCL